jgi:hypothetical protein
MTRSQMAFILGVRGKAGYRSRSEYFRDLPQNECG